MIVSPEKFRAIVLNKQKSDYSRKPLIINNPSIKTVSSVKLLGVQLDDRLKFLLSSQYL